MPELIAYLKQNPGKVFYASPGSGTSIHLAAEMFKMMSGTDMTHVPYKGSAPAMQDVIGGQVQLMFDNTRHRMAAGPGGPGAGAGGDNAAAPEVGAGRAGDGGFLPGFSANAWHGVFAPARHAAADRGQARRGDGRRHEGPGRRRPARPSTTSSRWAARPPQFKAFINEETDRWASVVHKLGLKAE